MLQRGPCRLVGEHPQPVRGLASDARITILTKASLQQGNHPLVTHFPQRGHETLPRGRPDSPESLPEFRQVVDPAPPDHRVRGSTLNAGLLGLELFYHPVRHARVILELSERLGRGHPDSRSRVTKHIRQRESDFT